MKNQEIWSHLRQRPRLYITSKYPNLERVDNEWICYIEKSTKSGFRRVQMRKSPALPQFKKTLIKFFVNNPACCFSLRVFLNHWQRKDIADIPNIDRSSRSPEMQSHFWYEEDYREEADFFELKEAIARAKEILTDLSLGCIFNGYGRLVAHIEDTSESYSVVTNYGDKSYQHHYFLPTEYPTPHEAAEAVKKQGYYGWVRCFNTESNLALLLKYIELHPSKSKPLPLAVLKGAIAKLNPLYLAVLSKRKEIEEMYELEIGKLPEKK